MISKIICKVDCSFRHLTVAICALAGCITSISGTNDRVPETATGNQNASTRISDGNLPETLTLPGTWFENDAPPPVAPAPVPPPTRDFDKTGVNEITFDDVQFEILPGDPFDRKLLTENIRRLDGLKIRVRGYIRPSFKQSGLQKFIFVRDNQECCFGPGAALYDCVLGEMAKGKSTDFSVRPVTLVGTFFIEEYSGPDGAIWAIFRMRDTKVE